MRSIKRSIALFAIFAPACAFAHHGTRFILAVEYDMVRQPFFFLNSTFSHFRDGDSLLMEPAVVLPIGRDGLSEFEVHAHIEKEGAEALRHEATGFEFRHHFIKGKGWNLAGALEYETTEKNVEEPNNWTGTLIVGKTDSRGIFLINFLENQEAEHGAKLQPGYRLAYSPTPTGPMDYSIEAQGDLIKHGSHELAFGIEGHLNPNMMVKFGIGFGLNSDSPRYAIHLGLVHALGPIKE